MQIYMLFSMKLRNFDIVSKNGLDERDKEKAG